MSQTSEALSERPAEAGPRFGALRNLAGKRGLRSYLTIVFFSGLTSAMSFLTTVVVARKLGPSEFGRFAVFYSIFQMTWTATNFGDSTYVRFANTHPGEETRYLRAAIVIELAAVGVLASLAYPLARLLSGTVFQDPDYHSVVLAGLVVGGSMNLLTLVAAIYQAKQRYLQYSLVATTFYGLILVLVGSTALAVTHLSVDMVVRFYVVVGLVLFVGSLGWLRRAVGRIRFERETIRSFLSFSRFLIGANVAYVLYQRMDVIFVARYTSRFEVGQYGVALRVAVLASLFTGSLAPFLLPQAARTKGSDVELARYLRRAAVLSASLLAIVFTLWLAVPVVTHVLFGDAYRRAVPLCRVLLLATACIAVYTPLSQLFLAEDRPKASLHLGLTKLVSTTVLLLLLAGRYGAIGCASAVACSEVVTAGYVVWSLRAKLRRAAPHLARARPA
ncbi:MAG: hypothetical protein QOK43_19 [Acidimicrobiaceae bacterium]|nr:hypothetical protein [Acidimicrobiaceae bacterium]